MLDSQRCGRILSQSFPELDVRAVGFFAQGWDYELWEVNSDFLFRFPKRQECAEPLRNEARLLAELAETVSVPVPRPEYVSDGCETFALPFFGYRKLPGEPLDKVDLSHDQREEIARQLGRFLTELHTFPPERAAGLGVPSYSPDAWREWYREFRQKCEREVSPLLSSDERAKVGDFWQRFLDNDRHFLFDPVLIHGDLGLEHVLVDPEAATITGVIDFGDAMVGDPGLDFMVFDSALQQAALASYDLPVDDTFLARIAFYWKVGPFPEVLYGFEIDDRQYVESGLEGVRRRILGRGKKHK